MVFGNVQKARLLSLDINLLAYHEALNKIIDLAKNREASYVCFTNVHMAIEAHWDKAFSQKVNSASLVLPDGVPIAKSLKLIHGIKQDRIAGMDALPDLIQLADENQLRIFFFGSTPDELCKTKTRIQNQYPNLKVVGLLSPPFGDLFDNPDYINEINDSKANIVFVALGCPKQEKWMASNSGKINATLLGIGGALSVFSGSSNRAPVWMQKYSLEWLYRLLKEPGRMWKRYLVTNTLFLYLLSKQIASSLLGKIFLR